MKPIFVVECPHVDHFYGAFRDEETANMICRGCCMEAKVVQYDKH